MHILEMTDGEFRMVRHAIAINLSVIARTPAEGEIAVTLIRKITKLLEEDNEQERQRLRPGQVVPPEG